AMLEITGLVSRYGAVRALDGVSLTIQEGSLTAVLGANGAGKTTLLRTITGLVRAAAGSVRFRGRDITRLPVEEVVRAGLAHVPEGRGVIAELTVEENLRLGALWRSRAGRAAALEGVYGLFPALAQPRGRGPVTPAGRARRQP